jgi:hypothetical protein
MISCRVNGPNRKSTIGRDTGAKEQEQGCIQNLVDEIYKKVTKWTCDNYDTIFLP